MTTANQQTNSFEQVKTDAFVYASPYCDGETLEQCLVYNSQDSTGEVFERAPSSDCTWKHWRFRF
eukprot:COSAG06_NODE_578_length_14043_cov_3.556153_12_plen_64_part_01